MYRSNKYFLITIVIVLLSCNRGREMRTSSGMKYILYQENKAAKPQVGDYVTIALVYKTEKDSVLFDSHNNKSDLRFELHKPYFEGSLEEGLMNLSAGDSATFFISADSMQKYIFKGEKLDANKTSALRAGSFLKMNVKMVRIQNYVEAEQEMLIEQGKKEKAEKVAIQKYLFEKSIIQKADTLGIYIIKSSEGKGMPIDSGSAVTINYEGKFFNGEIFHSTKKHAGGYTFTVCNNEVIKGWDIAFRKLREGDKTTLIIPSKLGYGEEGVRSPGTQTYIIPSYTPLLFEIEVVKVIPPAQPLSKK